jgi:cytochrome bd-type quinol oxidase subunit 2
MQDDTIGLLPHYLFREIISHRWLLILLLLGILGILTGMGQSFRRMFCNSAFRWSLTGGTLLMVGLSLILIVDGIALYPSSYQPSLSLTLDNAAAGTATLLWFVPVAALILAITIVCALTLLRRLLGKN